MSAKYSLLVRVFHIWPKLTHPAARSFCDSWATCTLRSSNSSRPIPALRQRFTRRLSPLAAATCMEYPRCTRSGDFEFDDRRRSAAVVASCFCSILYHEISYPVYQTSHSIANHTLTKHKVNAVNMSKKTLLQFSFSRRPKKLQIFLSFFQTTF